MSVPRTPQIKQTNRDVQLHRGATPQSVSSMRRLPVPGVDSPVALDVLDDSPSFRSKAPRLSTHRHGKRVGLPPPLLFQPKPNSKPAFTKVSRSSSIAFPETSSHSNDRHMVISVSDTTPVKPKGRVLAPPLPYSVLGKRKIFDGKVGDPPAVLEPESATSPNRVTMTDRGSRGTFLVPPHLLFASDSRGGSVVNSRHLPKPVIKEEDESKDLSCADAEFNKLISPRKRRKGDAIIKNGLREMAAQVISQANTRHTLWHSSFSRSLSLPLSHNPFLAFEIPPSVHARINYKVSSPTTSKLFLFYCCLLYPNTKTEVSDISTATLACSLPTQFKGLFVTLNPEKGIALRPPTDLDDQYWQGKEIIAWDPVVWLEDGRCIVERWVLWYT